MNYRCQTTRDLLEALEDGELEPREKARALNHLASCAGCRAAREANGRALSATRAALAGHPRIAAPRGFDARVWTAIEQRRSRPVTLRSRLGAWATRPIPRLLGSACFGLGVALALGGAAPSAVPARAVAMVPLDAEGSLATLIAIEQQHGSLAHRFRARAELQVLVAEPEPPPARQPAQSHQQPASQRRSQENPWTRPARASQGASSSDAGSLC